MITGFLIGIATVGSSEQLRPMALNTSSPLSQGTIIAGARHTSSGGPPVLDPPVVPSLAAVVPSSVVVSIAAVVSPSGAVVLSSVVGPAVPPTSAVVPMVADSELPETPVVGSLADCEVPLDGSFVAAAPPLLLLSVAPADSEADSLVLAPLQPPRVSPRPRIVKRGTRCISEVLLSGLQGLASGGTPPWALISIP